MNVIDTIHELRELMFINENIPKFLNQLDSNILIIEDNSLKMTYENSLLLLYYMYIDSIDFKEDITENIKKRNPCICFLNELLNSEFWSHQILLIDLIKYSILNNNTIINKKEKKCFKLNSCSSNINNLTFNIIIKIYKELIKNNKFRVVRYTLLNINIKLNMNLFESYSYVENLFKDNLLFPYKLYFLINFEIEINDNQMFNIKSIFDTFYLIDNWKIKLLLAKEISKIYYWDKNRGINILIYLKKIIIEQSKYLNISEEESINFGKELAFKLIEGLRTLYQTDLVLNTVLDLFNLFNEKFQESCLETLKTLKINGEKQENILKNFLNEMKNSSLFIKFSIFSLLKGTSDIQSTFIHKCINKLQQPNNLLKEIGTKITKEFTTEFRILRSKNSFVKNWQSRKKLIKCFEEIIISQNGMNLFDNFLKKSFINLFNDPVAEIRLSIFECFINLVCKFGYIFIKICLEELQKVNRNEAKRCIAFSFIYLEYSVDFCLFKRFKEEFNNKYLCKAIISIKEKNDENKEVMEDMIEFISDIVDSNALKWFDY